MQYNMKEIMETLDELEHQMSAAGDKIPARLRQGVARLKMQILSLNRYVDAVATIGALALAKDAEALAIEGAE